VAFGSAQANLIHNWRSPSSPGTFYDFFKEKTFASYEIVLYYTSRIFVKLLPWQHMTEIAKKVTCILKDIGVVLNYLFNFDPSIARFFGLEGYDTGNGCISNITFDGYRRLYGYRNPPYNNCSVINAIPNEQQNNSLNAFLLSLQNSTTFNGVLDRIMRPGRYNREMLCKPSVKKNIPSAGMLEFHYFNDRSISLKYDGASYGSRCSRHYDFNLKLEGEGSSSTLAPEVIQYISIDGIEIGSTGSLGSKRAAYCRIMECVKNDAIQAYSSLFNTTVNAISNATKPVGDMISTTVSAVLDTTSGPGSYPYTAVNDSDATWHQTLAATNRISFNTTSTNLAGGQQYHSRYTVPSKITCTLKDMYDIVSSLLIWDKKIADFFGVGDLFPSNAIDNMVRDGCMVDSDTIDYTVNDFCPAHDQNFSMGRKNARKILAVKGIINSIQNAMRNNGVLDAITYIGKHGSKVICESLSGINSTDDTAGILKFRGSTITYRNGNSWPSVKYSFTLAQDLLAVPNRWILASVKDIKYNDTSFCGKHIVDSSRCDAKIVGMALHYSFIFDPTMAKPFGLEEHYNNITGGGYVSRLMSNGCQAHSCPDVKSDVGDDMLKTLSNLLLRLQNSTTLNGVVDTIIAYDDGSRNVMCSPLRGSGHASYSGRLAFDRCGDSRCKYTWLYYDSGHGQSPKKKYVFMTSQIMGRHDAEGWALDEVESIKIDGIEFCNKTAKTVTRIINNTINNTVSRFIDMTTRPGNYSYTTTKGSGVTWYQTLAATNGTSLQTAGTIIADDQQNDSHYTVPLIIMGGAAICGAVVGYLMYSMRKKLPRCPKLSARVEASAPSTVELAPSGVLTDIETPRQATRETALLA
jgi:hypothetical protein